MSVEVDIDELEFDYALICKDRKQIVNELQLSDKQSIIVNNVIEFVENQIAEGFISGNSVSLPFVGTLQKNAITNVLKGKYEEFKNAKENLSEEEYRQFVKDTYNSAKKEHLTKRAEENTARLVKKNNSSLYGKYYRKHGLEFAKMKMFSLALLRVVEFDQEIQDRYEQLTN